MKKSLLAFSAIALLFTACKKDKDEPAPVTPTVQNLAGSYKLVDVKVKSGSAAEASIYDQLWEPCQKDDIYTLKADMTYQIQDAGTACDPAGNYSDTWALTNNTTIVVDSETLTIRKFDGKNLELTVDFMGSTEVFYYVKQ